MSKEILKKSNEYNLLTNEIKNIILESKKNVLISVNYEMSYLYWQIGKRINIEILKNKRADYGKEIIVKLANELKKEFGNGFSDKNIRRMCQFAEQFPEKEKVVSVIRQLSWTHLIALIPINDNLKREFYIELAKHEKWSVRQLRERIKSALYERTALSKKSEEVIISDLNKLREEKSLSENIVFKDPYILDFLELTDNFSEKDLESAILYELQKFIIELGSDFAFMARQKRITIDNTDYYIDLLFFHRRLKCLIAIDLKISNFEAAYKGKMELYLRYLEKYEKLEDENPPIGLILCTGKSEEHIELLQLNKSNIKVAEYITELPDKKLLLEKLHSSIEIAKKRMIENK